jgi:hypothetical protein
MSRSVSWQAKPPRGHLKSMTGASLKADLPFLAASRRAGSAESFWACPHLPAAAIRTPIKRPGLSTTVTCMPARSCAVSAIPTWRLNGNGVAGSILDPSLAKARAAPHRVSRQPERPFSPPGACSCRTEADFQEWRDQRDWKARKYALWGAGERLPSQRPSSMMRCICGKTFDSHWLEESLIHVPPSERSPDAAARKLVEIANAVEAVQDGGFTSSLSMPHSARPVARRTSSAPASNAPLHRAGSGCMNQEPM